MKKNTNSKIQQLFVEHLMKEGIVSLLLPNGMVLEVGVTQEDKNGDLKIIEDYCWVVASQKDRAVSIDDYSLGIRYSGDKEMICEHSLSSEEGSDIKMFDLI